MSATSFIKLKLFFSTLVMIRYTETEKDSYQIRYFISHTNLVPLWDTCFFYQGTMKRNPEPREPGSQPWFPRSNSLYEDAKCLHRWSSRRPWPMGQPCPLEAQPFSPNVVGCNGPCTCLAVLWWIGWVHSFWELCCIINSLLRRQSETPFSWAHIYMPRGVGCQLKLFCVAKGFLNVTNRLWTARKHENISF